MPKVINKGKIIIDGKEYDLSDFDDTRGKADNGFYGHMTHKSMQKNEESVEVSGDGFHDSSVPKTPTTDCFYHNIMAVFQPTIVIDVDSTLVTDTNNCKVDTFICTHNGGI